MSQNRVEQNPDLNNPDALRAAVAERYAEAVINVNDAAATTQQSCCSVSKLAGYDDAELDAWGVDPARGPLPVGPSCEPVVDATAP